MIGPGVSIAGGLLALALAGSPSADVPVRVGPARTVPVRVGAAGTAIEVREATLHGIPLRGAFETVERDDEGRTRTVAERWPQWPPRLRPEQAPIGRDDLRVLLQERGLPRPRSEPRLVYLMVLERPVLVWEVPLPLSLSPRPSLPTVWIGAAHGRLLRQNDAAFASRARVFPNNPATTPDAVEVELRTIDAEQAGVPLSSEGIEVLGCGPGPNDDAPPWASGFNCVPEQFARSDEQGDFFVPLPDVGRIEDNRAVDDTYAEVAAYHHVETFFAVMEERGLLERRCERFTVLTNMHAIEEDGLRPIDGASYIDSCNAEATPNVVLGQGVDADYAWDADVVHHELGHSVIQHLTPGGLTQRRYGPHGILSEAGAIGEGLADYFAMTVSGDPEVAEYIGRVTVASGSPYLRTGNNSKVCPDDLVSDWYADSQPVSAALWAVRSRLGPVVDEMVLRALPRLAPDAVLDELGVALWEVAQQMHDEGGLDDFGLTLTERSLRSRGLLGCLHVIDDPDLATTGKRMTLVAADERITPFAPGPLQLRYAVPADAEEVTIFFSLGGGNPAERAVSLLLRRDGEPITFGFEFLEDESILVTGDHELELPAESLNGEDFIARVPVEPGEVLHVALANRTPSSVTASNVFVVASEPSDASDSGGGSSSGDSTGAADDGSEPGGCGCQQGPTAPAGAPWAVLVLVLRRRRRE